MTIGGVARVELRPAYDVVIVGAGVQGLALAYELALRRVGRVAVLDRNYPGAGASGRNGEMIRSSFTSAAWTGLFDESLRRWHSLSAELGFNVLFTPAGYLIVASTAEELAVLGDAAARHREHGIETSLLDASEVRELVPALAPDMAIGAVYQERGGFAHHDAVVWGYARAAARLGVEIHAFTEVTGIEVEGGVARGVVTDRGRIAAGVVVNAAGGHGRAVARMAGVDLPAETYRLEMIVTESLAPFLRPGIGSPAIMGYCHQTSRGEFVGGTEPEHALPSASLTSTLAGVRDMAQKFVRLFPCLAGARLVRHWAGIVDQTADVAPILGATPEVDNFILDCGWVYGFMGAPAAGALLAELVAGGHVPPLLAPFSIERLRTGALIEERSLVISGEPS